MPLYLNPQAEHLIDWFHIRMRLTVMSQMTKGVPSRDNPELAAFDVPFESTAAEELDAQPPLVLFTLDQHHARPPRSAGVIISHTASEGHKVGRDGVARLLDDLPAAVS